MSKADVESKIEKTGNGCVKIVHEFLKSFFAFSIQNASPRIDQEGRFLGLAVIKLGGKFDFDSSLLRIHELICLRHIVTSSIHLGIQITSSRQELYILKTFLNRSAKVIYIKYYLFVGKKLFY
jgi:hypothetical protein